MNESLDKQPKNTLERGEELRRRILVVDNEEGVKNMLVAALEAFGYDVVTANNGKELLEKVRSSGEKKFTAVITDNNMPEMNGIDALEELREKNPDFDELLIIFMSGLFNDELKSRAERLKNVRCLKKPFGIFDLKKIIEEMIEKSSS